MGLSREPAGIGQAAEEQLAADCQTRIEATTARYLATGPRPPETMFEAYVAQRDEVKGASMPGATLVESINLALAPALENGTNPIVLGEDVGSTAASNDATLRLS